MYKILCPERIEKKGEEYLLKRGYHVVTCNSCDQETIKREIIDADAAIVRFGSDFNAAVLEAGKKLKVVARHGVGYENIDVETAEKLGIYVTNAKASNANAVAEHAMTLILLLAKYIPKFKCTLERGRWNDRFSVKTEELQGKKLGIIGFGANGSRLAQKAHLGLGMEIIGYDPYLDYTKMPSYIEGLMSAEDVFRQADVVSMHCPLNESTRYYVAARELEMMKPTAYVINCARGGLVKEEDLYQALVNKTIAGAALDVYEQEPPCPNSPLFKLDNFFGTLHQAGMTVSASDACALYAAASVDDVLNGRKPKYPVNEPNEKLFQERKNAK